MLMMLKRNCATLSWITTQSSNRLSGRRLASSQTETSSLSLPTVSVAWKCCSSRFDVDIRKNLYANVVLSHRETVLQLVSTTTQRLAPNVAVMRKCCSWQAPPVKEPTDSTTLLSCTLGSVTWTSARSCSPRVVRLTVFKVTGERMPRVSALLHPSESTRYGPSKFSADVDLEGRYR